MSLQELMFVNFTQASSSHPTTVHVQEQSIVTTIQEAKWLLITTIIIGYLGLVQALRFRRLNQINETYAAYIEDPHSLDYKTAHKIMRNVMLYEGPILYLLGTQMGILKSYSAQSGTKTLAATGQLTRPTAVGRRSEDTMTMLMEYIGMCGLELALSKDQALPKRSHIWQNILHFVPSEKTERFGHSNSISES